MEKRRKLRVNITLNPELHRLGKERAAETFDDFSGYLTKLIYADVSGSAGGERPGKPTRKGKSKE